MRDAYDYDASRKLATPGIYVLDGPPSRISIA
jgi:hypothetical protein